MGSLPINCSAELLRGSCRCHGLPSRRSFGSLVVRANPNRLRQSHQVRMILAGHCIAQSGLSRQMRGPLQARLSSRQPKCRRALQVSAAVAEAPAAATAMSADGFEISQESISESRRRLVITASPRVCKKAWQRMIKQARKDLKPPGFRDLKSVS